MKLGDIAREDRVFSLEDLGVLTRLTGCATVGDTIPEPLINSMFSNLLGMSLPGPGTNYLKQETRFPGQARPGECLSASVEVTRLRPEKNLVDLATRCVAEDGRLIAEGRALVLFARLKPN
jgi:3-hydroxybutyryl-CoA dehydratase